MHKKALHLGGLGLNILCVDVLKHERKQICFRSLFGNVD